ncbi:hypothetical protein [Micromonospora aurantiaca]|uniref:HK97 gp10 family phage protein n=1 Tax=Micromonospora aurantiaca (nom. illeg.) TaxID=47850 RepID=A0A6N3JWZ6_9ACTN|nr:hypothetical protein [Micromonospora aurantiaca]AXH89406.1 hypothetical protein DVH21_05340 [Micromonospora aurantiaca]
MGAGFVHDELGRWVAKLDRALSEAPDEVTKVVARGALNVKKDAQARAKRIGQHVRRYPSSIGYDLRQGLRGPVAEIGPEVGRGQGSLGSILENGSPTSPPHPHMLPAGQAEAPRFERALEDLAVRLLEGR